MPELQGCGGVAMPGRASARAAVSFPALRLSGSAYGMCTKLAAVKIIQLRNESDTAVNDPN